MTKQWDETLEQFVVSPVLQPPADEVVIQDEEKQLLSDAIQSLSEKDQKTYWLI